MDKVRKFYRGHWQLIAIGTLAALLLLSLLWFRLGSLVGGASHDELAQRAFAGSWRHLAASPLNLPLTFVQWICLNVTHQGQTALRLASTLFGALSIITMTYVLRRWYGVRIALYGTVLFACSAWLLHVSRSATPDVLYLWALPTLLATQTVWERHSQQPLINYIAVGVLAILLYIPGMFWFILLSLTLQAHHLPQAWRQLATWKLRVGFIGLALALLLPLLIAVAIHGSLLPTWLGLPHHYTHPADIPRQLVHSLSFFVWHGPAQPTLWLERLPVLDFFSLVMFILGCLFYAKHASAGRTRLLIGLFIIGAFFFAVGGPVTFTVLVPIVYLVIMAGMAYLLHDWLRVFPRNPLARGIGFSLLGLAVLLAVVYNVRSYFVAWPHNAATKAAFSTRIE